MSEQREVVIIGGGVIGLSTAWFCLKRGHSVTVLERGPDMRDCCSLGNAGMVVPSHFVPLAAPGMISKGLRWMFNPESPFFIRPRFSWELASWAWRFYRASTPQHVLRAAPILRDLSLRSRSLFEEFDAVDRFDFGLTKKGLLMLCKTDEMLEEEAEMVAVAEPLGIEAQVLSRHELARLDPGISMDVKGAVYFPQDCHLSPQRFLASLQSQIEDFGGRIVWETEVNGFQVDGAKIGRVLTARGEHRADEIVCAAGAWSPGLARRLPGVSLPMQAGKGYSITLQNPLALPEICSILCEAKVAVTPMGSALRFGGTMEIVGLDQSVNRRRVEGIYKAIPRYFPEFEGADFSAEPVWSGLRPCTPDGLPYIGRCRNYENVSVAAGHGMLGLSLGPVTGELMASMLSGDDPGIDCRALSPDRYA